MKHESSVLAFLEDENGKVIDHCKRKWLYAELQGFWNDNIDTNHPPTNWSSAGTTLHDKFRDILEENWKWSLLARQARKTLFDTGGSDEGSKCKWKESSKPANSHDDPEVSCEGPQPKKVKTGTASLSTVNKSQNHLTRLKNSTLDHRKILCKAFGFQWIFYQHYTIESQSQQQSHSQPIPGPSSMLSIPMTILTPKSLPTIPAQSSMPFTILKTLREKVKSLPKLVPTAKKTADVDVWETWDQKLNVLISHSIPDIYPLVARGKYGLITLVQLLEHLVHDRKVNEGLLHGKSSKGGKGLWVPPDTISLKWEAARDWKELNPNGTMEGFNNFWDSVQQDKDKLQVYKDRMKHLVHHELN
ncbi:hypothetical protein L208DRAFT_1383033 [Tricholoma matsutake]|nr:hypothetical protein L208DRAFT_1383033 [Tricholoma matsutake 945]